MNKQVRSIIALFAGVMPAYAGMIWFRVTQTENITITWMLIYPLLTGGGFSLIILLLNKYLLKKTFTKTFSPAREPISSDFVMGIILTVIFFILLAIERATIFRWLPHQTSVSAEFAALLERIAYNPLLLTLWLGPVLWIGVVFFEEVTRVFIMRCLWNLSSNKSWQIIVVVGVALLSGIIHIHQGITGIISYSIQGLLMGLYFYKFRRILPLIISHGLYDGLQIFALVMQYK
ncbi:MAG: CPBP family intramembrane glutamic endopeptidase [Fidelibacterota bacterium]